MRSDLSVDRLRGFTAGLLIVLGALAVPHQASAGPANPKGTGWRSVGPHRAAVEAAIASHPLTGTIYIATLGGGIFKSTDGGDTFGAINAGLVSLNVATLAMVPDNPNLVYAGTEAGVYKTLDGGTTWTLTGETSLPLALVMDPTNDAVLYAGFNGGLRKTMNGGTTWTSAAAGLGSPQVFSLAVDPNHPQVVYAGTTGQGGFRSSNGGASWTPLSIDSSVGLLVDPSDSNVVFAGTNGNGVYRSTDAGATFTRVGSPDVGVVIAMAKSGNSLYAGTATDGVSVSDDGGATWKNTGVSKGLGLILTVDSEGTVYAGTNFDGVFRHRSDQPGRPWEPIAESILHDCNCQNGHALAIDPSDPRHVFFSTNDGGLLETQNGGLTWKDGGTSGLLSRAPRSIAFDPQTPRFVYAGSFTGGGFYRSEDRGQHWERVLFGSSAIYVAGVDVDPVDHTVYVSTFRSGDGIWKSTDFGRTFTRIDRAPGAGPTTFLNLSGRGITVDPARHATVYFAGGNGVWRSLDAGESWIRVNTNASLKVTVDPTNSDVVYAAGPIGVFKSVNGGNSFVSKSSGLPTPAIQTPRTGALQVNPANPQVLYVGSEGAGVFMSTDGAESWHAINTGLDDLHVYGLAMDPTSPDILYASTSSAVFKTTTAGQ